MWAGRGGHRDRAVRDLLVAHYAPLVRGVAARTAVGLPASVDAADLVQAGVFGLLDAIARYDPSRGIRFESYAAQRIRGAMLDELRAQDWVPRTVRTRLREIDRARERLERRLGRSPVNAELAAELGIPIRDLLRISQHRRLVSVEGLQERRSGTAVENVVDDAAPDPAAAFALRETYRELADAVLGLGERDRLVVQLYYVENRTLAEIGALLGVTESRVCQLHGRLVGRLRGRLDEAVAG
ncbi:MAG: RNA polymerase subunit sigma-70 [Pseudonocardia sp. SCN 72-86]|nr:MAG: RNA polymerase subunit sigma-70 [Pseudonocardia sp. SCN 72-86]